MNCRALKGIRSFAVVGIALILLTTVGIDVAFADAPAATNITLSVTKTARFGQAVHLSARLIDPAGAPISGAKIAFVAPDTFFLGTKSDMSISEVQTDKDGVAEADYQARDAGLLTIRADFRGNDRYAASRAVGQVQIDEPQRQLYVEHAGVQVPGLDAPPTLGQPDVVMDVGGATSTGLGALWPRLSVWPIALVLLIIWSLYAVAVRQMFTIASASSGDITSSRTTFAGSLWNAAGRGKGTTDQGGTFKLQGNGEGQ